MFRLIQLFIGVLQTPAFVRGILVREKGSQGERAIPAYCARSNGSFSVVSRLFVNQPSFPSQTAPPPPVIPWGFAVKKTHQSINPSPACTCAARSAAAASLRLPSLDGCYSLRQSLHIILLVGAVFTVLRRGAFPLPLGPSLIKPPSALLRLSS